MEQLDKFNEKIEENATRRKRLGKQNHNFSKSLKTCQSIKDDKIKQVNGMKQHTYGWDR